MTKKHVLIVENEVHADMRVWFVLVGSSARDEQRKCYLCRSAMLDADIYFSRYDMQVCKFLHQLSTQVYPGLSADAAYLRFNLRNVRTLRSDEAVHFVKSYQSTQRKNLKSWKTRIVNLQWPIFSAVAF